MEGGVGWRPNLDFIGLAANSGPCQTEVVKKPAKAKPERKPREHTNRTAYRVTQETIKRSEERLG